METVSPTYENWNQTQEYIDYQEEQIDLTIGDEE